MEDVTDGDDRVIDGDGIRDEAGDACVRDQVRRLSSDAGVLVLATPRDVLKALGRSAARTGRTLAEEASARLAASLTHEEAVDTLTSDVVIDRIARAVAVRVGDTLARASRNGSKIDSDMAPWDARSPSWMRP